jgi:hypothetical protein
MADDAISHWVEIDHINPADLMIYFGHNFTYSCNNGIATFACTTAKLQIPVEIISGVSDAQYTFTDIALQKITPHVSALAFLCNLRERSATFARLWQRYGLLMTMPRRFSEALGCMHIRIQSMVAKVYAALVALKPTMMQLADLEDVLLSKPWIVDRSTEFATQLKTVMEILNVVTVPSFSNPSIAYAKDVGVGVMEKDMMIIWIYLLVCDDGIMWMPDNVDVPEQLRSASRMVKTWGGKGCDELCET